MTQIIFIMIFIVLILFKLPISFAMGLSCLYYILNSPMDLRTMPQQIAITLESFILLAVPLFMLAGQLMNQGGVTDRIFKFANNLVGHIQGGLAQVNIIASIIFSGMSGSAVADSAGLGAIEIKAMVDEGFDPAFAAAVTGASSTMGPIIPPSMPMIIYGAMSGVSVGALFVGGIIPGLLMGLSMIIITYFICLKAGYPVKDERTKFKEIGISFLKAFPSLLTPLIILGGIILGIFTPTEAAGVASIYALILGVIIYKDLKFNNIIEVFINVSINISGIMYLVAMAGLFGWIVTRAGIPRQITGTLLGITENPLLVLLILNALILVLGMFMETIAIIVVLTPILLPILDTLAISRLHFGVVLILNLMIGLMTPPLGVCLYVVSQIAKEKIEKVFIKLLPYYAVLVFVLLLIILFPILVTFLPSVLM